MHGETLKFILN